MITNAIILISIILWIYMINDIKPTLNNVEPYHFHRSEMLNKDSFYPHKIDNTVLLDNTYLPDDKLHELNRDIYKTTTNKFDYYNIGKNNRNYNDGVHYDMTLDNNVCDNTNRIFFDVFNDNKNVCPSKQTVRNHIINNVNDLDDFVKTTRSNKIRHIYDDLVEPKYSKYKSTRERIKDNIFYSRGANGDIITNDRWKYKNETINNGGIIDSKATILKPASKESIFFATGKIIKEPEKENKQYIQQNYLYPNDTASSKYKVFNI